MFLILDDTHKIAGELSSQPREEAIKAFSAWLEERQTLEQFLLVEVIGTGAREISVAFSFTEAK